MVKVYSTSFPIDFGKEVDNLTQIIKNWIVQSPHKKITSQEISNMNNDGFEFRNKDAGIQVIRYKDESDEMYCFRLTEENGEAIRTTDIAGHRNNKRFRVSIVHGYEAIAMGGGVVKVKKPIIVNKIIDGLGGGVDGLSLRVQRKPHTVTEDDLPFVAEIIKNESDNDLPVIYVSKDSGGYTILDPFELAYVLGGMAHVLVEPSRRFSFDLRDATKGKNVFNGAVGIYWPNGFREYFLQHAHRTLPDRLYESVRGQALLSITPESLTFDGIKSLQAVKKLEELRLQKTESIDDYLALTDQELERRDKRITELTTNLQIMEARLGSCLNKTTQGQMLISPQLPELYAGETTDLVISALNSFKIKIRPDSRMNDFLTALLSLNKSTGKKPNIKKELEKTFRANRHKLPKTMITQLTSLGFYVEEGQTHTKVSFGNKIVSIAKTPSDHRSRENELARIKNILL